MMEYLIPLIFLCYVIGVLIIDNDNITDLSKIIYIIVLISYSFSIYTYSKNIEERIQTIESYIQKKEQ